MDENPSPEKTPSQNDQARKRALEAERIQALRERLYARGSTGTTSTRHPLGPSAENGERNNQAPQGKDDAQVSDAQASSSRVDFKSVEQTADMATIRSRRKFRIRLALVGVFFFVAALVVSSFFFATGGSSISGDNITLSINGPLAVGGGENLSFQIAIANQNTLPIESATLIIEYPKGTQSITEAGKVLYSERQQLNNIESGEVVNVPIRAFIFGEENEEKIINASVEYRVKGSNATFYKEAEPYRFKVSTSPVVVSVDAVKSIPTGQETDLTVVVQSNSPTELTNVLLKGTYPTGFDYTSAKPEPSSGQDTWRIPSLKPGEKQTIVITGVITGVEKVPEHFNFAVGVASEQDPFILASQLMAAVTDIEIEKPFLDVSVNINGTNEDPTIITVDDVARVSVTFKNSLSTTMYDGFILVELDGNALDEIDVKVDGGHYDSAKNKITWDAVDIKELRQLGPGASYTVTFTLDPRKDIKSAPEVGLKVSIEGNRVLEDRVPEKVTDTTERTVKIASNIALSSAAVYTDGPFTNTGPTPPVAEKTTQYTYYLAVDNTTNEIADAEVTAVLPQYVTWLDLVSDGDEVTYTASTRTMRWVIGNLPPEGHAEVWVQVGVTPSLSQVGLTPTILESQRLKAVDRFTGTILRSDSSALTTSLDKDPDPSMSDGEVKKSE